MTDLRRCFLEPASFTIQFQEHLSSKRIQYCLDRLSDLGGSVESTGIREFRIVCSTPEQLRRVGIALFHSFFRKLCPVVATSGAAENRGGAYQVRSDKK